jgi:sugar lactone lactonase YvrE
LWTVRRHAFAGGWLVTCYDNGTVVKIGADGQTERVWDKDSTGAALVGPNDATADGKGGAYVTASGPWESGPIVGKVYHLLPTARSTPVADDLHYANGINSPRRQAALRQRGPRPGAITFAVQTTAALPTGGCSFG